MVETFLKQKDHNSSESGTQGWKGAIIKDQFLLLLVNCSLWVDLSYYLIFNLKKK